MNDNCCKFKYTGKNRKKRINRNRCVLRLAVAVMEKNMFHLLLFLFDIKFYELWTKEVRKLKADVKHMVGITM